MLKATIPGLTLPVLLVFATLPVYSQSIKTEDDIETDGQLVSNAPRGTAPLAVGSSTVVRSLNADRVDGFDAAVFARESDLQTVEQVLVAILAQFPEL